MTAGQIINIQKHNIMLGLKNNKMTSLQIAELIGKNHGHVMRSIRKMEVAWVELDQSKFGLISYIDEKNRAQPMYNLSKKECLYIATKFNDTARAKLILRWEELELEKQNNNVEEFWDDPIIMMRRKQIDHDRRLRELEAKTTTRPDYFSVAGFARLQGLKIGIKMAANIGRKASRTCKINGYDIDKTNDPRFGQVNLYPKSVLEGLFTTSVAQ